MKRKEKRFLQLGEQFEENKKLFIRGNYDGLYNCYDRPSGRKVYIYDYYEKLLYDNADRVERYGVASYNTNIITLEAIIQKDGARFYVYITPSYNYFLELEEEASF